MYIIVGLGNPGRKYEHTKHNIGFIAIDILAQKHDIRINKIKHKALIGEGNICAQKVLLVKPQTYMNLSGNSVREIVSYYKLPLEKLIVVYDDIDIPMGDLRIRGNGSAGTHNGMRSIIYDLQNDNFPRVRIGIGGDRTAPISNYVIGGFSEKERVVMKESVIRAVSSLECILDKGIVAAMNEYNNNKKRLSIKEETEKDG